MFLCIFDSFKSEVNSLPDRRELDSVYGFFSRRIIIFSKKVLKYLTSFSILIKMVQTKYVLYGYLEKESG